MCGYAAAPLERVRVGFVGLGMRGPGAVERMAKFADVDIVGLCDIRPAGVERSQEILAEHGRPAARAGYPANQVLAGAVAVTRPELGS